MKTLLTTLSILTFATTTGNLTSNLNNQIKIINDVPIKYDGKDKICTIWKESNKSPATLIYIKSSTLDTWLKLFFLHDIETLRETIYYDTSSFPYQGNGWSKTDMNYPKN